MSISDKIYYQDEWATIYCGDCREILSELPKVDLVLTDPPYGINFTAANYEKHNKNVVLLELELLR